MRRTRSSRMVRSGTVSRSQRSSSARPSAVSAYSLRPRAPWALTSMRPPSANRPELGVELALRGRPHEGQAALELLEEVVPAGRVLGQEPEEGVAKAHRSASLHWHLSFAESLGRASCVARVD